MELKQRGLCLKVVDENRIYKIDFIGNYLTLPMTSHKIKIIYNVMTYILLNLGIF